MPDGRGEPPRVSFQHGQAPAAAFEFGRLIIDGATNFDGEGRRDKSRVYSTIVFSKSRISVSASAKTKIEVAKEASA